MYVIRKLSWAGAWIFIVLATGLLALRFAFPNEKIRAIIEERVQDKFHRAIRLQGIHLGFSGLDIDHLELSETPDFAAGTFLIAEQSRLTWALIPLIESIDFKTGIPETVQGQLRIQTATTPFYKASDFAIAWDLDQFDSTGARLNGEITLDQGPALFHADRLIDSGTGPSLLLVPLKIAEQLNELAVLSVRLPDLNQWKITRIQGEYRFDNGIMTIGSFAVTSKQLSMQTQGTVALATHAIALNVLLHLRGASGPLDAKMRITGTTEHPKVNLDELKKKAFKATFQNLLDAPSGVRDAADNLKKLFH